jgi:hypothetical protein
VPVWRRRPTMPVEERSRERCPDQNWGMILSMLTTMPIPDSDDILDLEPTRDGLGSVASITRRRKDGSVMWTALPPGSVPQDV